MNEKKARTIDIPVAGLNNLPLVKDVSERLRSLEGLTDVEIDPGSESIRFRLADPSGPNGSIQKAIDVIRKAGLKIASPTFVSISPPRPAKWNSFPVCMTART
jgi:hypothetical protein